jgi:5-methylcytosine-specific restriction endonuclease McrA
LAPPRIYSSHAAKLRAYRERDRDRHNKKRRDWVLANPEKYKEIQRRYYQANKEKLRANWASRDARKRKAEGKHTQADIDARLRMQRYRCAACRASIRRLFHIDHIVPLKSGGTNYASNIQLLCPPCNRSKGAQDPMTFMQSRGLLL